MGNQNAMTWTVEYATPLLKTVNENFYLPVKECKHFVLFSNCEITTDWYLIKLVYVYIMAEEKNADYIRESTFREECLLNVNFPSSSFFSTVRARTVITKDTDHSLKLLFKRERTRNRIGDKKAPSVIIASFDFSPIMST